MADRISNLPDSLLCYILSFLPTKVVVATSVLSSRWKLRWTVVPALDFDDEMHKIHMRLDECVCRVLILRNNEDSIKKLRIKCKPSNCSPYHVNTWISAAIKRKVEHLELCTPSLCIELPRALFNCATLVTLKLIGLSVESCLSTVQLPSLKHLHFEVVQVCNGVVRNVLSGCPGLEKLVLKCLAYDWEEEYCQLDTSFPNLVEAELDFMTDDDLYPSYVLWVFNILKSVCDVKFLTISEGSSQFDFHSFAIMKDLPIFHYLTQLKLRLARMWLDILPIFLQKFSRLEVLVVDKFNWAHPNWWWKEELTFVPICVSSHLISVDVRGYEGSTSDLKFARYLLKNAKVLKTMTIRMSADHSGLEENLLILKELSAIPRASPMCKLLFNEINFS